MMHWRPVFGSNDDYIITVSPKAKKLRVSAFGTWSSGTLVLEEYSYITEDWDTLPGYSWSDDFLTTINVIPGYQYRFTLSGSGSPNLAVSIFEI